MVAKPDFHAPCEQWQIGLLASLVLPALEHRGHEIEFGENVAEAGRQHLVALEGAAQDQQGHVDGKRKGRGVAPELLVEAARVPRIRRRREQAAGPGAPPGAERIGEAVSDVAPERLVELREALGAVRFLKRQSSP